MIYLTNAFSLGMLPESFRGKIEVIELSAREFVQEVEDVKNVFSSAIGHQSTAEIIKVLTGVSVEVKRIQIRLQRGDILLVLQLGFRPEEGRVYNNKELLQFYLDGKLRFFKVRIL